MKKHTAHWIRHTHILRRDEYVCSACGARAARPVRTCPRCGAAMKSSKQDLNWIDEIEGLGAILDD